MSSTFARSGGVKSVLLGLLLPFAAAQAGAPTSINFQGRLLNNGGQPVNGSVPVAVTVWSADTGGSLLFTQHVGSVTVESGLYDFEWGDATLATALTNAQCWLQVHVNGDVLAPRQRLLAVPYALRAGSVDAGASASGGTELTGHTAYEDIAAGDAVGLSHFYSSEGVLLNNADAETEVTPTSSTWYAQKFRAPGDASVVSYSTLYAYCRDKAGNSTVVNGTIRLRSSLSGADIASATTEIWNNSPMWIGVNVQGLLTPGADYYVVVSIGHASYGTWYKTTDQAPLVGGERWTSTDSGASWTKLNTTGNGDDFCIRLDGVYNGALGHYQVFKASAAAFNNRFSFHGYAKESAVAGQPVTIIQSRVTTLHAGLSPGRKYYLSNTPGQISTTPGTVRLELGRAAAANTLVRTSPTSPYVSVGGGSFIPQMPGTVMSGDSSSIYTITVYDRVDLDAGETTYTRSASFVSEGGFTGLAVQSGDQVSSSWSCRFAPQLP
jgi:hypothetical protein